MQQQRSHSARQINLSSQNGSNRAQDFLGGLLLDHVTQRACSQRSLSIHRRLILRQNQNAQVGPLRQQRLDQIQSVSPFQPKIQNHQIRLLRSHSRDRFRNASGFSATCQVTVLANESYQPIPHHRMIIHHQNSCLCQCCCRHSSFCLPVIEPQHIRSLIYWLSAWSSPRLE